MRRNIGRNSGALNGLPATFVNSCTPRAPSERIARSISLMLASTWLSGNAATKVGNACGYFRQISAKQSLAMRASRHRGRADRFQRRIGKREDLPQAVKTFDEPQSGVDID